MKKSFHSVVGRAIITVATGLSALVLSSSLVMAFETATTTTSATTTEETTTTPAATTSTPATTTTTTTQVNNYRANANPQTGYESLYDTIMDKGANNGRCNAIGVLASLVCDTTAVQLQPPLGPITDACGALGITVKTYCDDLY